MKISIIKPTREEIQACVARATDVQGTNDGFLDSRLPGCDRWILNYLGSAPDAETPSGVTALPVVSHLQPGFGVSFVKAAPGNGVPGHAHDTNETFMVLEGKWRIFWEGDKGTDSIDLERYDLISIPPGVIRWFENLEAGPNERLGVLLGVIAGDHAKAEYSREAIEFLVEHDRVPAESLADFEPA